MASYVESFASKLDWAMPFQRTGAFPIDRTDLFSSLADAKKYAKGNVNDPDSRGLAGSSYIGQIITVYENDLVTVYKIDPNRDISPVSNSFELKPATDQVLGGIIVGAGLSITESGILSATGGGTADAVEWGNILDKPNLVEGGIWIHGASTIAGLKQAVFDGAAAGTLKTGGLYQGLMTGANIIGGESEVQFTILLPQVNHPIIYLYTTPGANCRMYFCYARQEGDQWTNNVVELSNKTLTESDLTALNAVIDANYHHTDENFTAALKTKLESIASGAQVNIIEQIKVNGELQTVTGKAVDITVPTKTSDITNDSGYQTAAQVESAITDKGYQTASQVTTIVEGKGYQTATQVNTIVEGKGYQTSTQVQTAIKDAVATTYKPAGSVLFADLPTASQTLLGNVYNVKDNFTTDAKFLEEAGKSYPAGTNVVIIQVGESYLYDVLAGFVDLSGYMETGDVVPLTNEDIETITNS